MAERLSREALYDLVWSEPVKTLSARFGISDVALKKTCAKADIPTPDRGYWAKKDAGKDVEQRPLPERSPGMENEIRVAAGRRHWYEDRRDELLESFPPAPEFATPLSVIQERIAQSIGKVVTPREVKYWQPAISRLLANDEKRREKQRASSYPSSWDNPLFDTPVERRRLRILNSLGFALARVSSSLCISNDGRSIWFAIHQQQVSISLESANAKPRRGFAPAIAGKSADERLELSILKRGGSSVPTATWKDDETGKLEARLTEIAVQIGLAAEIQLREHAVSNYQWRVERKAQLEEQERQRKLETERVEKERREKLEQARVDRLLRDARAFEQAGLIRKYVDALRTAQGGKEGASSDPLDQWAEWALAQAERIDPSMSDRYLAAIRDAED